MRKFLSLIYICFLLLTSCNNEKRELLFREKGLNKKVTLDEFYKYSKNPNKQRVIINSLNRKSRQYFLKQFVELLNIPIDHSSYMILLKNGKIVIDQDQERETDELLFGSWNVDNEYINLKIKNSHEGLITELGFVEVVIDDIWLIYRGSKSHIYPLEIYFKIKKIEGMPKENTEHNYSEIKKGIFSFLFIGHGFINQPEPDQISKYCKKNKCE